jgi:hypothetical protein
MRISRLLTLASMSLIAIALIAAAGCSSETEDSKVVSGDSAPKISAQSTVETEPEQVASLGMPAPGSEDENEMIVVLEDGVAPITDGSRDLDDVKTEPLFVEGEPREGADPVSSEIRELPDGGGIAIVPQEETEEASDPLTVREVPDASGLVSSGFINPDSCDNVLPQPTAPLVLRTRSATDTAKADNPAINTMCMAWYVDNPDEDFVSVVVLAMNSDDAAIAHYAVLHGEFENGGMEIREQKGRDRDWMAVEINQGGIGEMAIVRIGSNLVSVHNGPTSDQAEWDSRWIHDLADSVAEQLG